jgi:hypothetical protein
MLLRGAKNLRKERAHWARLAFFQAIGMHKPKPLALWEENL